MVISFVRGRVELNFNVSFLDEAAYFGCKVRVVLFPVASWDVCPVCVGDDGVELCY